MEPDRVSARRRRPVNVSLPAEVKRDSERRRKEANREAIESWNRWLEANGLPSARYRLF